MMLNKFSLGTPQPLPMPAQGSNAKSTNSLMFSPSVTIQGDVTPEQQKKTEEMMSRWSSDLMRTFNEQTRLKERKAF